MSKDSSLGIQSGLWYSSSTVFSEILGTQSSTRSARTSFDPCDRKVGSLPVCRLQVFVKGKLVILPSTSKESVRRWISGPVWTGVPTDPLQQRRTRRVRIKCEIIIPSSPLTDGRQRLCTSITGPDHLKPSPLKVPGHSPDRGSHSSLTQSVRLGRTEINGPGPRQRTANESDRGSVRVLH